MVEKNESLSQFVIVCSVKYGHEIHEKNCKRNKKKIEKTDSFVDYICAVKRLNGTKIHTKCTDVYWWCLLSARTFADMHLGFILFSKREEKNVTSTKFCFFVSLFIE